jgi:hypothetical protein
MEPSPGIALPQTAAIDWLLRSAAGVTTTAVMLRELCDRLVREELPIAAARLAVASLDPMIARRQMRWRRSEARVAEEIQFHGMAPAADGAAESANLTFTVPGTLHKIEWSTEQPEGFDAKTRKYLEAITLVMASPLQTIIEREISRSLLQAYLGRRVAERVLSGTIRRGTGEEIDAVVWISDLRDFTRLSEALTSDQVITALNDCCARLVGAIQPFGGEVFKFIGDGILAIFPAASKGEGACVRCRAIRGARRARGDGGSRPRKSEHEFAAAALRCGCSSGKGGVRQHWRAGSSRLHGDRTCGQRSEQNRRIVPGDRVSGTDLTSGSNSLYDTVGIGGQLFAARKRQSSYALHTS